MVTLGVRKRRVFVAIHVVLCVLLLTFVVYFYLVLKVPTPIISIRGGFMQFFRPDSSSPWPNPYGKI